MQMFKHTKNSSRKPWHIKAKLQNTVNYKVQSVCGQGDIGIDNKTNDFIEESFKDYGDLCVSCIIKAYQAHLIKVVE